ncbi:MAG: peptide chain release factor N(5)-glutamine methyltransferase [Ardenticatenaceae bacterium]|nr:peptide chain release factor N(5)-glutamine methyltransferase [Ardenticatenaceae bacterium]MCB8991188.1 peptide chain release factor N(5)-glutamine methyltransferase [Ardenticatenaceae bacterium]MCB9005745.1 peptide chain release factor N(5)-glutamine methyltransferase [Ardenticatenaceae bacterium]
MTIREALALGREQLQHVSPTAVLDTRLLLQFVLGVTHSFLVAHDDEELTAVQQQQYTALLRRAQQKEPIPYLIGTAPFYGMDFAVSPAVLIPRPETEELVELAINWARPRGAVQAVDVGTGSGCIAISLAANLPQAQVTAVDISPAALAIAQQNAHHHTPGRIQFHQGALLSPLSHSVDLIAANLPYITDEEWTDLDDGVKLYEPAVALKGGLDGLSLIQTLLYEATTKLNPGGLILLEIGWQQGAAALTLAQSVFPTAQVQVLPDLAGHDRIVRIDL